MVFICETYIERKKVFIILIIMKNETKLKKVKKFLDDNNIKYSVSKNAGTD